MKELVAKLRSLEKEIAEEKGDFTLFALFLREDAPDRWDLVVSAPWFGRNEKATLDYFASKVKSRLKVSELLMLSRIVLISPSDPSLGAVHTAVKVKGGEVEMSDRSFFGLPIKHAYIITSRREQPRQASTTSQLRHAAAAGRRR